MSDYLSVEELTVGKAYEVHGRNIGIAIWDGHKFHGVRHKFTMVFMDSELHWDEGSPYGTCKPLRELR